MKKISFYLTVLVCCLSSAITAQTVTYNVQKGTLTIPKGVREGDIVTVMVENVNRFCYNVNIKSEYVEYNTPMPDELSTLFRITQNQGANTNTPESVIKASAKMSVAADEVASAIPTSPLVADCRALANFADILAQYGIIKTKLIAFSKQPSVVSTPVASALPTTIPSSNIHSDFIKKYGTVEAGYESEIAALTSKKKSLEAIKPLDKEQQATLNVINSNLATLRSTYGADYVNRKTALTVQKKILEEINPRNSAQDASLNTINSDLATIKEIEALTSQKANLDAMRARTSTEDAALDVINSNLATLNKAYEEIEEAYETLKSEEFNALYKDITELYYALLSPNSYTAKSAPIQMSGDFLRLTIEISPRSSNPLLPSEEVKKAIIEIPTKGGWKADFSVGPTMAIGDNATDDTFYLEEVAGSTTEGSLKQHELKNNVRPGIAAMIHVGPRALINRYTTLAGMMGVGAGFKAITDPDINLYFGGSLILGKRSKTMVSAGICFSRVARLNTKQYQLDNNYPIDTDINSVSAKIFSGSFFFSVSYNLTNESRTQ